MREVFPTLPETETPMIRFACSCGRHLQAREEDIGRKAQCPSCGAVTLVPDEASSATVPEDGVRAERPVRPRREAREDSGDRPRRRRDRDLAPASTSGMAIAAMWLGISALFLLITAIPGAILGMLALRDIGKSDGELGGKGMAVTGLVLSVLSFVFILPIAVMAGLLFPAVSRVQTAKERMQDANNLRQMGIAMQFHHETYGTYPRAAAFQDGNGKPLLSWRVALLPFIEQGSLYNQFRLDEPWDSPNNKALLPLMPKVYALPNDPNPGAGMTHYQVFVGPGSAFEPRKLQQGQPLPGQKAPGWKVTDFTDGTSNTILIATSATPVPWTKPDDMPFDPQGPLPQLGRYLGSGHNVAFADGSVRLMPYDLPDPSLRAAITRNGGEVVNLP